MACIKSVIFQCLLLLQGHFFVWGQEPICNKFSFEEQLLEKMIRMEVKVESMFDSITKAQMEMKDVALTVTKELNLLSKERERIKNDINVHKADIVKKLEDAAKDTSLTVNDFNNKILRFSDDLKKFYNESKTGHKGIITISDQSVTYIRWGRTSCPNLANLLYEGYASGSNYQSSGGSSDTICLPKEPQFGKYHSGEDGNYINNAEFQEANRDSSIFRKSMYDQDVPCAVCEAAQRSAILMIPARLACYDGWHLEYSGYLMTSHQNHRRTDMKCVDANPEGVPGQGGNDNGDLFYFVEVAGAIPDPPYTRGKELTCVVCTK